MFDDKTPFGFALPVPALNATPALYVDIRCPSCESFWIRSHGPLEIDRYAAARLIRCCACGNEWTDTFDLSAYPA